MVRHENSAGASTSSTSSTRRDEPVRSASEPCDQQPVTLSPVELQELIAELQRERQVLNENIQQLQQEQEILKASELRYFDLYDLAPVGYLTLDARGLILEANLTAAQLLKVPRADLAGLPLTQFLSSEDRANCILQYRILRRTGSPQSMELHVKRKDGTQFWARADLTVTHSSDKIFLLVITDITERKQAEHAQIFLSQLVARTSEEDFFRAVLRYVAEKLDTAMVCINRLSRGGSLVTSEAIYLDGEFSTNVTYCLNGTPCGELLQTSPYCVTSGLKQRYPETEIVQQLNAESYYGLALNDTRGRTIGFIVAVWRQPLADRDYVASLLNLVASRVAAKLEQHIADERLKHAFELLERVGEIAGVGGWELDIESQKLTWTNVTYQLHEMAPGTEVSLADAIQFYPDESRAILRPAIEKAIQSGTGWDLELLFVTAKGRRRWVQAIGEAERLDGRTLRLFGTFRDITTARMQEEDRRRTELQLRHSQKMEAIGQLAGGIAHDFNNILTVINGTADLAGMHLADSDPLRQDLNAIRQAGERAAALTRQLVAFSRKQPETPGIVDVNQVLTEMRPMLRRLIRENISISILPSAGPAAVCTSPGQLEQVVMNLCVNAHDAMPDGGALKIEVLTKSIPSDSGWGTAEFRPGDYVELRLSDTGAGMDAETSSRVFEPFFTTKEFGKGTGLGLSTVYGIVAQGGGRVTVSSSPGVGTTFTVLLPLVSGPPTAIAELPDSQLTPGNETILLVEDEFALLQLVRQVLSLAGYRVIAVNGGYEALQAAANHNGPVHLMLTDIVMPEMGGLKLAELIRVQRPETRILFTSGYSHEFTAIMRDSPVPPNFIAKPYRLPELTRRIREIIDAA
jgi:PAS domain S-box-containing protein